MFRIATSEKCLSNIIATSSEVSNYIKTVNRLYRHRSSSLLAHSLHSFSLQKTKIHLDALSSPPITPIDAPRRKNNEVMHLTLKNFRAEIHARDRCVYLTGDLLFQRKSKRFSDRPERLKKIGSQSSKFVKKGFDTANHNHGVPETADPCKLFGFLEGWFFPEFADAEHLEAVVKRSSPRWLNPSIVSFRVLCFSS